MSFFDLAREIEKQGYDHYSKLADMTPVREIAGLFKLLAREEQRHLEIFDALAKNSNPLPLEDTQPLEKAKAVFISLSQQFKTTGVPAFDHDDAFEKALEFENKSLQFYTDLQSGKGCDTESKRAILSSIIDQEKIHVRFITSLMDFFRHPGEWLENAEWRHADEF